VIDAPRQSIAAQCRFATDREPSLGSEIAVPIPIGAAPCFQMCMETEEEPHGKCNDCIFVTA